MPGLPVERRYKSTVSSFFDQKQQFDQLSREWAHSLSHPSPLEYNVVTSPTPSVTTSTNPTTT